jgi:hydroxyacylglutathione hydrolase
MLSEIKAITLSLPYRLGGVNCYLLKTDDGGYILVDSGSSNKRKKLEEELEKNGCQPGNLRLIILTHGDFDHTANAAYFRKKFGSKIAIHYDDSGMVEQGDMFFNRKRGNILLKILIKVLTSIFFGFGKSERFKPDLYVDDGYNLSEYGLDARVIHIPGHSKGSIGILTGNGDLFCGDLLTNGDRTDQPKLNSIIDDTVLANASVKKLRNSKTNTVYPGHGKPFPMEAFIRDNRLLGI